VDIPDDPTPDLIGEARGILGTTTLPELPIIRLAAAHRDE
jgi:hypothetical protein